MTRAAERRIQPEGENELELLIDDEPIRYGRLPNGSYFLDEYAYDWRDDLMDLARRFINHVRTGDMGVRKNYRDLTAVERDRFVQALHHVKSTGVVDQFAQMHAMHFSHGIHRSSHFLPWHRELLRRFEDALQTHHPEITLPYWNSTVDRSPSDPLWENGFLGQFNSARGLGRALGSATLPTSAQVESNQGRGTYDAFWPELESVIHNPPHRWVGGVMASTASPGDPVFYLHHCPSLLDRHAMGPVAARASRRAIRGKWPGRRSQRPSDGVARSHTGKRT